MILARLTSRYALVSLACLVAHNVVVIAGCACGQSILAATTTSFAVVVVIGYLLHSRYTFRAICTWRGFARYAVAMAANVPASFLTMWVLARGFGWPAYLAAPAATALMVAANFIVSRWAIIPRQIGSAV